MFLKNRFFDNQKGIGPKKQLPDSSSGLINCARQSERELNLRKKGYGRLPGEQQPVIYFTFAALQAAF